MTIDTDVVTLWRSTVSVHGSRPAIVDGERTYTYAELDAAARVVAERLRAEGIGAEDLVVLCARRGFGWFAAMLGTLGAGAAFVPIDVEYPAERIRLICQRSGAHLVLGDAAGLRAVGDLPVTAVDLGALDLGAAVGAPELAVPHPRGAAYVVFTSGSSGQPKGVTIEHRSLGNTTCEAVRAYGFHADDRILQFNSLSFDTAYEEIFPAFAAGAALVLRGDETAATARHFWCDCVTYGVTVVDLTPAFWQELVAPAVADPEVVGAVRLVILGGDRLPPHAVAEWQACAPLAGRCTVMASYGPTETTIIVSAGVAAQARTGDDCRDEIPIGEVIANVALHVVGAGGGLDTAGELCIAGVNVARGYHRDPRLTADRFRPDPWSAEPGGRMYLSGDAARVEPDGSFSITGRLDRQVKVRGYRVEPAELEAALARLPGVQRAAVRVVTHDDGGKGLVAYVLEGATAVDRAVVLAALRDRLPKHLVPDDVVVLGRFPLTMHGKVDYAELPVPAAGPAPAAPDGDADPVLAAMRALLGNPAFGRDDNFFQNGGHSILAMRLLATLSDDLGIEMPLLDFFQEPTASAVERYQRTAVAEGMTS